MDFRSNHLPDFFSSTFIDFLEPSCVLCTVYVDSIHDLGISFHYAYEAAYMYRDTVQLLTVYICMKSVVYTVYMLQIYVLLARYNERSLSTGKFRFEEHLARK